MFEIEWLILYCPGLNGEYLAISGNAFKSGKKYRIRLKSNGSYVEFPVQVNSRPYGGNCSVNTKLGGYGDAHFI